MNPILFLFLFSLRLEYFFLESNKYEYIFFCIFFFKLSLHWNFSCDSWHIEFFLLFPKITSFSGFCHIESLKLTFIFYRNTFLKSKYYSTTFRIVNKLNLLFLLAFSLKTKIFALFYQILFNFVFSKLREKRNSVRNTVFVLFFFYFKFLKSLFLKNYFSIILKN